METDHPGIQKMTDIYHITGWPFFVFISPGGTLLDRNFPEAFNETRRISDKELGTEGK